MLQGLGKVLILHIYNLLGYCILYTIYTRKGTLVFQRTGNRYLDLRWKLSLSISLLSVSIYAMPISSGDLALNMPPSFFFVLSCQITSFPSKLIVTINPKHHHIYIHRFSLGKKRFTVRTNLCPHHLLLHLW